MIQDINKTYYVDYKNKEAEAEDYVVFFKNRLIGLTNENVLPKVKDALGPFQYLFTIGEHAYYSTNTEIKQLHYENMIKARKTPELTFAIATASHLVQWYERHQYCGVCGHKTVHKEDERALVCPSCHNIIYPNVNVAILAAVTNENKILLTKYARGYALPALVAGFTEIGESLEMTVKREVYEECGIHIKEIQYYGSQPWGYGQNMMIGFITKLDGSDAITLDTNELAKAEWVSREDIPDFEEYDSLTRHMIRAFKENEF